MRKRMVDLEVVAELYEGTVGLPARSKETHRQLARQGIQTSEVRVRKWIALARQQGLIPPVQAPLGTVPMRVRKADVDEVRRRVPDAHSFAAALHQLLREGVNG